MARDARSIVLLAAAVVLSRCAGCGGEEEFSCPSGQVLCLGICTDPATYATDAQNCGGCGIRCGFGTCEAGACACTSPGGAACAGQNPLCADTQNDRLNCGACGNVCQKPNSGCANGTCQCVPGSAYPNDCSAYCANFETDPNNCGGCGSACPLAGAICVGAGCRCPNGDLQCPAGTPTKCVDPATDASNCGGCGIACPAGHVCKASQCVCPTGETECSGACVDLAIDAQNCGSCGHRCATGATCTNSSCGCPAGPVAGCGGTCCTGGSTCCGGACPIQHSNGVGQSFYDCLPLGTYDAVQAEKAARAWQPSGSAIPGIFAECPGCLGWQTPPGTAPASCGTWCYAGPLQGKVMMVQSLVCTCAGLTPGTWN